MRRIVTQETSEAIQELITEAYRVSAKIDRMKSIAVAKFNFNNTADVQHFIAHYYLDFVDYVIEMCMERYDIPVDFGDVPRMSIDYNSMEEMMDDFLDTIVGFEDKISYCIGLAAGNADRNVSTELQKCMRDHNQVTDQAVLMNGKIKAYNGSMSYDSHIKHHFLLINGKLKLGGYKKVENMLVKE